MLHCLGSLLNADKLGCVLIVASMGVPASCAKRADITACRYRAVETTCRVLSYTKKTAARGKEVFDVKMRVAWFDFDYDVTVPGNQLEAFESFDLGGNRVDPPCTGRILTSGPASCPTILNPMVFFAHQEGVTAAVSPNSNNPHQLPAGARRKRPKEGQ